MPAVRSHAHVDSTVIELLDQMNEELPEGQTKLTTHMLRGEQRQAAIDTLAMFFFTSCTPPERANNAYLQRFAALMGFTLPTPKDLLGQILTRLKAQVEVCSSPNSAMF